MHRDSLSRFAGLPCASRSALFFPEGNKTKASGFRFNQIPKETSFWFRNLTAFELRFASPPCSLPALRDSASLHLPFLLTGSSIQWS
jgi:hypothetical protein